MSQAPESPQDAPLNAQGPVYPHETFPYPDIDEAHAAAEVYVTDLTEAAAFLRYALRHNLSLSISDVKDAEAKVAEARRWNINVGTTWGVPTTEAPAPEPKNQETTRPTVDTERMRKMVKELPMGIHYSERRSPNFDDPMRDTGPVSNKPLLFRNGKYKSLQALIKDRKSKVEENKDSKKSKESGTPEEKVTTIPVWGETARKYLRPGIGEAVIITRLGEKYGSFTNDTENPVATAEREAVVIQYVAYSGPSGAGVDLSRQIKSPIGFSIVTSLDNAKNLGWDIHDNPDVVRKVLEDRIAGIEQQDPENKEAKKMRDQMPNFEFIDQEDRKLRLVASFGNKKWDLDETISRAERRAKAAAEPADDTAAKLTS